MVEIIALQPSLCVRVSPVEGRAGTSRAVILWALRKINKDLSAAAPKSRSNDNSCSIRTVYLYLGWRTHRLLFRGAVQCCTSSSLELGTSSLAGTWFLST